MVYLHDREDQFAYKTLGSIFDDVVVDRLFAECDAERDNAASRYL
jgi:hypothetical protein